MFNKYFVKILFENVETQLKKLYFHMLMEMSLVVPCKQCLNLADTMGQMLNA